MKDREIIDPLRGIERVSVLVRGFWVLLDEAAADFYQVKLRTLRMVVSRNPRRFQKNFSLRLSKDEIKTLPGKPVYAFTMRGLAMLASVLKSKKAIQTSIKIIRYRVAYRHLLVAMGGYDDLPSGDL